jgi:hypothetical protein
MRGNSAGRRRLTDDGGKLKRSAAGQRMKKGGDGTFYTVRVTQTAVNSEREAEGWIKEVVGVREGRTREESVMRLSRGGGGG